MANMIFATFQDVDLCEKAAGALLDYGMRGEDISLIHNRSDMGESGTTTEMRRDRDAMPGVGTTSPGVPGAIAIPRREGETMGDMSSLQGTQSETNRLSDTGSRSMGDMDNQFGATRTSDQYRDDAEQREDRYEADRHMGDDVDPSAGKFDHGAINLTNGSSSDDDDLSAKHGISTTTAADAGAGAIKGTGIGLGVGAVAALASLFVPGVGLVVGGGALAAALGAVAASAGAGAAAGAVTGYLKDQGVDEHVAQRLDETIRTGGAMLSVHVPSGNVDEMTARSILEKYGATNVHSHTGSGRGFMA